MLVSDFTYSGYENMLKLIMNSGYDFCTYHNYTNANRPCILRHDVDIDLEKALYLARLERQVSTSVVSTYFVLLRTNLYNVASVHSIEILKEIERLGHKIGLHFDEVSIGQQDSKASIVKIVEQEASLLSSLIGIDIQSVSMHRPSTVTLESNYQFDGLVNSYDRRFFHDFKYVSDSRHLWRESAEQLICSKSVDRLHILTHPFWYTEINASVNEKLLSFVEKAKEDRYSHLQQNIRDIEELLPMYEVSKSGED